MSIYCRTIFFSSRTSRSLCASMPTGESSELLSTATSLFTWQIYPPKDHSADSVKNFSFSSFFLRFCPYRHPSLPRTRDDIVSRRYFTRLNSMTNTIQYKENSKPNLEIIVERIIRDCPRQYRKTKNSFICTCRLKMILQPFFFLINEVLKLNILTTKIHN